MRSSDCHILVNYFALFGCFKDFQGNFTDTPQFNYSFVFSEMKHNMTNEEREDLNHWYKEAKEGEAFSKFSVSKKFLVCW